MKSLMSLVIHGLSVSVTVMTSVGKQAWNFSLSRLFSLRTLALMCDSEQMSSNSYLPIQQPNVEIKSLVSGHIVVLTRLVLGIAEFASLKIMK